MRFKPIRNDTDVERETWQRPLGALPERFWDAIVVGAGPAGAMASRYLAGMGHCVLVIDKQRFPRDKVCGDALIPDSIRCLQRAGLYDAVARAGYRLGTVDVYSPSQAVLSLSGAFITCKRIVLDHILARAAAEHDAVVCQGHVADIAVLEDHTVAVACKGYGRPLRARVALIATGADVSLLSRCGMAERPRATAVALRCYIRSSYVIDRLTLSFDRAIVPGYAWIFPVSRDEYNVGCGVLYHPKKKTEFNLRDIYRRFVSAFPLCRSLMVKSTASTPLQGARLRCGLRGACVAPGGNVLAIGETIGATFPFTGEGIGKAMETGEIAAEIVHDALTHDAFDRLHDFPRRLEQQLRPRYKGYQMAEDWLGNAWLNDLVIRRARKSRFLREAMNGIITETVDPGAIFSFRGLLKSLWK